MTEWEPATETEAAMRDALRAGDQELYFRILARTDLLLPVSAEALAGRAPMGWGTWTTGGRTHVLAFTSTAALRACLAENAGSTRRAPYPELASGWPNPEWWLAVNPGLPIEGYLPAWFVSQLSRGDVRLPGRSVGARARLEQVERARARATAAVPRRLPEEPMAEPAPAGAFRTADPDGLPYRPTDPDGLSRSPGASRQSADPFRSMDADPFRPAHADLFQPANADPFRATDLDPSRSVDADAVRRMDTDPPRSADDLFRPAAVDAFRRVDSDPSGLPRRSPGASGAESFRSMEPGPAAHPFLPAEPSRDPVEPSRDPVEPFRPVEAEGEQASMSTSTAPATVPVIAPTPARGGLGGDFGSQISEDTSAGWMTPAGPTRPTSPNTANGSLAGAPGPVDEASSISGPPSGGAPGGPPPAWHGPAGQQDERPTEPVGTGTPEERPGASAASWTAPPEVPAPATWTPPAARSEPSLFTPVSRRPADASSPETSTQSSGDGADPVSGDSGTAEGRPAEQVLTGTGLSPSLSDRSFAADSVTMGSPPTERFAAAPTPTEQVPNAPSTSTQFGSGSAPTEPTPAGGGAAIADPGTAGPAEAQAGADPAPARHLPSDDPAPARHLPSDFVPANEVERSLLDAAGDGSTDTFLSTLLLAKVLLPVAFNSAPGARPGDDGFEWRTELLDGERYVVVFTSPERLGDHLTETIDTVEVKFAQLIRRWPDDNYSFAVNPGTPVGAKLPGGQIVALANWAAEVGLGDDTGEPASQAPAEEEAPRPTYAPARDDPARPTIMQKTVAPSQLSYYLDRGYDRVSGFVHRASEVAHLRTPAKLYAALGLNYPGSPFDRDAEEVYVLRWPAYRPSLYRIPYGGQNEAAMRAMEGWVIERPPFRGNGFAPGESSDVVAEFKVDSVRLPHGAELHRIGADGSERLVATLDCDVPVWRRAEEG